MAEGVQGHTPVAWQVTQNALEARLYNDAIDGPYERLASLAETRQHLGDLKCLFHSIARRGC